MTRRVGISILCYGLCVLTAQAQWNKQDSLRLQELLKGEGEVKINQEAVNAIRFDFSPEKNGLQGAPLMVEDKPWMKFRKELPKNLRDTTTWNRPAFIRLTPYTPYTRWNEDPISRILSREEADSIRRLKMYWELNVKLDPSRMNGHVDVPAGMDPTVTPGSTPMLMFDTDKFLYENLTKRGRAIRRNRKRAHTWKTYQDYIPTLEDTVPKDSLRVLEFLRQQMEDKMPFVRKDSTTLQAE